MESIKQKISEYSDAESTIKTRKKEIKKSIDLIDSIIADGAISDSHLRMLIEQITVTEKEGKLTVNFMQVGSYRIHFDYYDDRNYERGVEGERKFFEPRCSNVLLLLYTKQG